MIEFATLLSAVKPKERSDQYRILAALFYLKAHVTPVSTKDVRSLLKLHCGKKMPASVNSSLKVYTGYVEPVVTGSSQLWSLTSKGIDRLRNLSRLSLSVESDAHAFETDIGIICALEHPELAAVTKTLGGPSAWKEAGNTRFAHVYDSPNFSKTLKEFAPEISGSKESGYTLTARGLANAAGVVKEMLGLNKT
jgi:hypothetical protein